MPDDFTPRSMTPSLVLSGRLWNEALRGHQKDKRMTTKFIHTTDENTIMFKY